MGGKLRAKQFFQKHTNSATKKDGKKIARKKCEKASFYSHNYCDQNMGGKNARNIFPETQE